MMTQRLPVLKDATPPVALREIDINLTNLCNLECVYCSYSSTPDKREPSLPTEIVKRVLTESAAMGNRVVHWSGGEPVIRADMADLVEHAASLGFGMRMLSNGALLSREKLGNLWSAGLRKLLISLDGFEENHNYHRADPTLYPKTLRGIENGIALGYNVRVNTVATVRNVDEIPRLFRMVAEMGAATFTVFYCIPVGRGRDVTSLSVPPLRWRRFIEEMKEAAAQYRPPAMEVTVEKVFLWEDEWEEAHLLDEGRGGSCLGFLESCDYVNILADGRVYPCVCFLDEAPPLGNIRERPLADILHDPAGWAFYWSMRELNGVCKGCEMLSQCRGGNRPHSRFSKGDWFALDPRCSGEPRAQGYMPLCYMLRENVANQRQSGFAEPIPE